MPGFAIGIQPARGVRRLRDTHVARAAGARRATERWATGASERCCRSRNTDPRQTRLSLVVAAPAASTAIREVRAEVEAHAFSLGFLLNVALATDEPRVDEGLHHAGCRSALEA